MKRLKQKFAQWLLKDVKLSELRFGENSVIIGDQIQFDATATPTTKGQLGMDVATGRPQAFVDGSAQGIAVSSETGSMPSSSQHNTKWTLDAAGDGASVIKVEPRDTDQKAYISVSANGENPILVEVPGAGLTWDITSTGAIGGTRGAAEASDTGYELYCVAKADGADPALISEVNGTALTYAALAAVDADYVLKSAVVSFGSNTQGGSNDDLVNFEQYDNHARYLETLADMVFAAGKETSATAVDASDWFPEAAKRMGVWVQCYNYSGTSVSFEIAYDAGLTLDCYKVLNLQIAYALSKERFIWITSVNAMTTAFYYKWSAAPSQDLTLYAVGFEL